MSINIRAKTDVSFLFSSLGSGAASVAGSNWLSDYASIKNGSYAKLMKAYYSETASDSVKSVAKNNRSVSKTVTSEESARYAKVQTTADSLKESADALLNKSLFTQKDIVTKNEDGTETAKRGYDTDAIYKAVNSFVTSYNSVIGAVKNTDDDTVARRTESMVNQTAGSEKALLSIGISVNADNTLSLDKDAFMKADMTRVKSLFNGSGSYGYQVSARASMIDYAADNASHKRSFYNAGGGYHSSFNNGNLFNTYF